MFELRTETVKTIGVESGYETGKNITVCARLTNVDIIILTNRRLCNRQTQRCERTRSELIAWPPTPFFTMLKKAGCDSSAFTATY